MTTLDQIVRFGQQPSPLIQGLQSLVPAAQAIGDARRRNQAAKKAEQSKQAYQLLGQAFSDQTADPMQVSALIDQARELDPELTFKVEQMVSTANQKREITPAQQERFDIDRAKLDLRRAENKLQSETNALERERLENQIKLQRQKIEANDDPNKALMNAKESEKKAASFADRMNVSGSQLDKLELSIDPTSRVIPIIASGGGVASEAANRLASSEEQQYAIAASDFVTAQLRKESGAVIGDDEFKRKYREFFPVPGDSETQIESKRKRRQRAINAMKAESGGLYESLYQEDSSTDNTSEFTSKSGIKFTVKK